MMESTWSNLCGDKDIGKGEHDGSVGRESCNADNYAFIYYFYLTQEKSVSPL